MFSGLSQNRLIILILELKYNEIEIHTALKELYIFAYALPERSVVFARFA